MKPSNEKLLTEYCKTETNNNVEMVPPDGGWGYMIGFGSLIIMVLGAFPIFAFSIILSPILMTNEVSSVKSAWIFNLHALTYSFYALFVGPLCEEFGHRKVAFFGGVTVSISVVISAFAPSADFLFFSYGILGEL
ncbi:Monocarboxylate transporter 7 [Armadillidium vulgare]|nr:Monocarboxylate transporter 7 [Armadillidium vulgare]